MISLEGPLKFSKNGLRMRTNRYLFIASDYKPWPGGIATYIDCLARGLMSLGETAKVLAVVGPDETERIEFLQTYEPWVTSFSVVQDRKPTNWLGRKSVSLLEIFRCLSPFCRDALSSAPFFESSTASIKRLEEFLSIEEPTAIIFGHLDVRLYALALALLKGNRPYGILAHDYEVSRFRPENDKRNEFIKRSVMLRGANWIAANSRHTESLLKMWNIPSDRIKLVHPPISEQALSESHEFESPPRTGDELNLVTICRLVRGKGIDIMLRALKILGARGIPFRYVIGGEGPERKFLEALTRELVLEDKVEFKGAITDEEKWSLLRHNDVFVMPSRVDTKTQHEGFGIAFVEAAAFGVPAVGSNAGGIPDAVIDGKTGILVSEESSSELADALTMLYRKSEIRIEMGRVGKERAHREFSPIAVATHFRREISNT
jgi:glycosyltransferase involved in cell wall biosynthesis